MSGVSPITRNELKKTLIRWCYWYYVKCNPLVTDRVYDIQFNLLKKLESEDGVRDENSPTQIVWGDCESQYPEWAKLKG